MVDASVIVPVRNGAATLARTLDALAAQDFPGTYEVFVVDNGSTDDTVAIAEAAPGPVTVLTKPPSPGPGEGRNLGVASSTGAALAFCDADVFPTPGWLREGVAALESADLVQGKVLPDPDTPMRTFDRSLWITYEVGLWETANLFVRRETFEGVGGFEDWLFPGKGRVMGEDVWFGWRAVRAGARTAFAEEALAYHAVFERGARDYVAERARLRFFPAMAAKAPELRHHFFFARVFLSRRSAAFDLALAGLGAARLLRSPVPLLALAPYVWMNRHRRRAAPVEVVADAVGLAAMLRGSVAYRSPLL